MHTSRGRVFEQTAASLDESSSDWPSPGTQAFPTLVQVDALVAVLQAHGVLSAVSIGCGEGALEAMLERRGVAVCAVDLDVLSDYTSIRSFCSQVIRIRPNELFELESPAEAALCFFWGSSTPWREYLAHFPQVPVVVVAGAPVGPDGLCATKPDSGALDGIEGWHRVFHAPMRCVSMAATLTVWARSPT